MALLDEDKLQGRVLEIVQILRQQASCCDNIVSGVWMHDANNANVFVLITAGGSVIIKNSPTGDVQSNPALPLKP